MTAREEPTAKQIAVERERLIRKAKRASQGKIAHFPCYRLWLPPLRPVISVARIPPKSLFLPKTRCAIATSGRTGSKRHEARGDSVCRKFRSQTPCANSIE